MSDNEPKVIVFIGHGRAGIVRDIIKRLNEIGFDENEVLIRKPEEAISLLHSKVESLENPIRIPDPSCLSIVPLMSKMELEQYEHVIGQIEFELSKELIKKQLLLKKFKERQNKQNYVVKKSRQSHYRKKIIHRRILRR